MPIYEYECKSCGQVMEVQQRMSEDPLTDCPACKGELKKLISSNSFQLKGGGWYSDGYSDTKSGNSPESSCPAASGGCGGCPVKS
ncbi:MAG: zinc ribbon domain-containing protein [Desulfotalea sp.]